MTHQTPVRRIVLPCLVLLALAGAGCDISADQNGFSMTLATGRASDPTTVVIGGLLTATALTLLVLPTFAAKAVRHRKDEGVED